MNVKMRTQISGTRNGEDWPTAGTVVDLPDDEATALVDAGLAEETDEEAAKPAARRTAGKGRTAAVDPTED